MNDSLNIVIIEDDQGLNELIQRRLSREHHHCTGFSKAADAFAWLENNGADMLLVDLMLPDCCGDELVKLIKTRHSDIPFIIATGQGSEDIAVKMLKNGAKDYLVKNSEFLNVLPTAVENVWREIQLQQLLTAAQRQIQEKNAILTAIHQLSPDGIFAVDHKHRIISCNQRLLDMFHIHESILNWNERQIFELLSGDVEDKDGLLNKTSGLPADFEGRLLDRIPYESSFYELYTMPMRPEEVSNYGRVWYLRDISLHVEAEQQKELARVEAERNVELRSQFFAVVSHDVKTPLNSIIGFLALLQNSDLNDEQKRYAEIIKASSEHLFMLINDILDLTRIEQGSFELSASMVRLRDLIDECIGIFFPISKQSGIELKYEMADDVPAIITTDSVRLKQILINLLGNAMKFTHKGHVSISVARQDNDYLIFRVTDTGTGIPEEVQEMIFTPFTQANSDIYNRYGGSGLGLAITKQLVERFGGSILLTSSVGKGSTFTFTLPFEFRQHNTN